MSLPLLCIELLYVFCQSIEPFFPDLPIAVCPVGDFFQGTTLDPAAAPLCVPPLGDQAGVFQHTKVFGDGGHAHFEGLGEFADGAFAQKQTGKDGSAGGIRKGCKCGGQSIGCHLN